MPGEPFSVCSNIMDAGRVDLALAQHADITHLFCIGELNA